MRGKLREKKFFKLFVVAPVLVTGLAGAAFAEDGDPAPQTDGTEPKAEKLIRQSIGALIDNRPRLSLKHTQDLLEKRANFRLGKLIRADLLAARAHQDTLMAHAGASEKLRIRGMVEEARTRLRYRPPPPDRLPDAIAQLSGLHEFAIAIDASRSRLYVFANREGVPRTIFDHYISTGNGGIGKTREGDKKTPLGVYHLVSYLDGGQLPELYGTGAYPINYPNHWDRLHDRHGYGIWLHGTPPAVYSRPPKDSRGCVVISNQLLETLASYVDLGRTPVVIAEKIRWLKAKSWDNRRERLLPAIERWQRDWQSLNVEKYLSHYSQNYRTVDKSYAEMTKTSRINSKKKTFVNVDIKNIDLFDYPGESDTVLAVFDQDYRSNNYNIRYRKQQLWRHEGGRWKIIFEGRAETESSV